MKHNPFQVTIIIEEPAGINRFQEPVTCGIPLPQGFALDSTRFRLTDQDGLVPIQTQTLATWPDSSIKWLLLDFQASVKSHSTKELSLKYDDFPDDQIARPRISIAEDRDHIKVDTGVSAYFINTKIFKPFDRVLVGDYEILADTECSIVLTDTSGIKYEPHITSIVFETRGPIRTTLKAEGLFKSAQGSHFTDFFSRVHFYTQKSLVKLEFTLLNPRAAEHPGGLWDLGDSGSIFFKDLSLNVTLPAGNDSAVINCQLHDDREAPADLLNSSHSLCIYQDSSGGENWQSRNHANRDNEVKTSFRGYRVYADEKNIHEGLRATPALSLRNISGTISGTVRHFWQNFPKAIEARYNTLCIRIFPGQFNDVYELQGGEQKTHEIFLDFNAPKTDHHELAWCHSPLLPKTSPEWYAATKAIPYMIPEKNDPNRALQELINTAISGDNNFFLRREIIDEYGWRDFGEFYADHEAVGHSGTEPLVSHYNNQYDGIYGTLIQFIRSGQTDWFLLADQLCSHLKDIDIYHTDEDRPEFNHGLFWHSEHYLDTKTATHRCFSRQHATQRNLASYGGGPALSHNYSSGLLLHHYLTGSMSSKKAVLEMASFVISNIDMGLTVCGRIIKAIRRKKNALKNMTGNGELIQLNKVYSLDGPGRASGNSLNTLLDAYTLTGADRYLVSAEKLILNCINPEDDIVKRDLLDAENRWMYTIFLQALGKYLDLKSNLSEFDSMWHYVRRSLVHYSMWMAEHEYPYLDKPEKLEYPNETWATQDLRKCNVFLFAAKYASPDLRPLFLEKADFFYNKSTSCLMQFETRHLTRPIVLAMQNNMPHGFWKKLVPENFTGLPEDADDNLHQGKKYRSRMTSSRRESFRSSILKELIFIKWRIIPKLKK